MTRTILVLFASLALLVGACGDDDDTAATTTTETSETSISDPTSTTTTTTDPDSTDGWERCENPDGFSLAHPAEWSTNDGTVVGECSQFDPEPFEVPEATDERVAAITAYVDPVPFDQVAAPGDSPGSDRAVTSVDGHQAVRVEGPAGELYPEGTSSVRYMIDMGVGTEERDETLFVDTLDLPGMDYEENVTVLDRMVRTIEFTDGGPDDEQTVVARYGGGGTPFAAAGEVDDGTACVTAPIEGDSRSECFNAPDGDGLRFTDLSGELLPIVAGVTGSRVFRVDAEIGSGTFSFLPVAIDGTTRGFAMPIDLDDVRQLTWHDLRGTQLGARVLDEESDVDPVGSFSDTPQSAGGFPGSGETSFLTDLRVATHDGFDRVVFEFHDGDLSWQIEEVDEVRATSGERVPVEGDTVLKVSMTPASRVDLSGSEPDQHYDGPYRIGAPAEGPVEELAWAEDFEKHLVWAVGVTGTPEIAVVELDDPQRLVIDIRTD